MSPWTILGWIIVVLVVIATIAFPFAIAIVLRERRRVLEDFNRIERDLPRHARPVRRFR